MPYVSSQFLDALNMCAEFYADTYYGNSDAKTEQHECWSQLINCQGLINPNLWVVFMLWGNEFFVSCLGPPELIREAFMSQPRLVIFQSHKFHVIHLLESPAITQPIYRIMKQILSWVGL